METGVTRYGGGRLLAVPALHKDGRRISIEFSIQFMKDADGQTKWVVAVIRGVTERYLHEKPCVRTSQVQGQDPRPR